MKKKLLLSLGAVVFAAAGVFAGKYIKFATATDLYAKPASGIGSCTRLVTSANVIASSIVTSGSGSQAQIKSTGNTQYNLWEDNSCSRAVYFN